MSIGFSIKAWDKLNYGDVVLAINGDTEIIGKISSASAEDAFIIDRNQEPEFIVKSDGWEIKLRSL